MVPGAVACKFLWKFSQHWRDILIMAQPNGHHHPSRTHDLAVLQSQLKAFGRTLEPRNGNILQLRNELSLERQSISRKSFQRNGKTDVSIRNALLLAIRSQSKLR